MLNPERTGLVIPTYNEGSRVIPVIEAGLNCEDINEVVVVNDGSTDNTREILGLIEGVTVLEHDMRKGKGGAMESGAKYLIDRSFAKIVFLDGDLCGIGPEHISKLLDPLEDPSVYMSIGYLGLRKALIKKAILNNWGALSGQRAIRSEVWGLLDDVDKSGFNIEAALNARLRKAGLHRTISRVVLEGVGHVGKQHKEGTWPKALVAYARTYGAAAATYWRVERTSI